VPLRPVDVVALVQVRLQLAAVVLGDLITWALIVPLSLASLATGLISALGTTWGVVRHYWVLAKLVLSVVAAAILLLHTHPIGLVARAARERILGAADLHDLRIQLVADAAAALLALLANTTLSVFKPRGMTRYGWRKQRERPAVDTVA